MMELKPRGRHRLPDGSPGHKNAFITDDGLAGLVASRVGDVDTVAGGEIQMVNGASSPGNEWFYQFLGISGTYTVTVDYGK